MLRVAAMIPADALRIQRGRCRMRMLREAVLRCTVLCRAAAWHLGLINEVRGSLLSYWSEHQAI
jgi:hypothetical protein